MKIFLIRHGESQSNCDSKLHQSLPDHEIALSSRGIDQAEYAGEFLKAYFEREQNSISPKEKVEKQFEDMFEQFGKNDQLKSLIKGLTSSIDLSKISNSIQPKIKLYHSSYRRTRETKDEILKVIKSLVSEVKEDVLLAELQMGLFDGLDEQEQAEQFPREFAYFQKSKMNNGKFWARYPGGESGFDVMSRLQHFSNIIKQDEIDGVDNVIIIGHGATNKIFIMNYLNKNYEWFENEKTSKNCGIRLLEENKDFGYIL